MERHRNTVKKKCNSFPYYLSYGSLLYNCNVHIHSIMSSVFYRPFLFIQSIIPSFQSFVVQFLELSAGPEIEMRDRCGPWYSRGWRAWDERGWWCLGGWGLEPGGAEAKAPSVWCRAGGPLGGPGGGMPPPRWRVRALPVRKPCALLDGWGGPVLGTTGAISTPSHVAVLLGCDRAVPHWNVGGIWSPMGAVSVFGVSRAFSYFT